MKKLITSYIFLLGLLSAAAQTEPQYALYMFTKQAINPGSVGSRAPLSIGSDYRNQWSTVEGAPETFNLGIQVAPLRGAEIGRHAGGINFYYDKIGVANTTAALLQYAYRVKVSEGSLLSFGVQGGLFNINNNLQLLQGTHDNDPVQQNAMNHNLTANMGAGIYLFGERYFVGASVPQLFITGKDLDGDRTRILKRHYFLMAGYLQPLNDNLKLRFNAMVKHVYLDSFNGPLVADFNLSVAFFDRILAGANYRTENTVSAIAQIQLTRTLNLGYAFDFLNGNYSRFAGNSHEIFLGFDISAKKAPFTTPRFVSYF